MDSTADRYDGPMFDADNHYYEAEDAFTRYVPKRMQRRCVPVDRNARRQKTPSGR